MRVPELSRRRSVAKLAAAALGCSMLEPLGRFSAYATNNQIADNASAADARLAPAWHSGQPLNAWRKIPGSNPSAAEKPSWRERGIYGVSGPRDAIGAWCGASIDTRSSTLYHVAGGGHAGYYGNQVMKLDLRADRPRYEEAAPPSPASQIVLEKKVYLDGRPSSRHTYSASQFIEARNRAMCFGSAAVSGNGNFSFGNIVSFDPATGLYEADGKYSPCPVAIGPDRVIFKDPLTEDVHVWFQHDCYRWNQASDTWTLLWTWRSKLETAPAHGSQEACVDSRRNRVLVLRALTGAYPGVEGPVTLELPIDVGAPRVTRRTFWGSGASQFAKKTMGWGAVFVPHPHDESRDCFLLRRSWSGATVFRINAVTFEVDRFPAIHGEHIPEPYGGIAGIYNRLLYVPQLGGVVLVPTYEDPVWFLRTS